MSDVLRFLAAVEGQQPAAPPPWPSLDRLVTYSLGEAGRGEAEEVEHVAISDDAFRIRLFDVWKVVCALEADPRAFAGLSPFEDPFRAEIVRLWKLRGRARAAPEPLVEGPKIIGRDEDARQLLEMLLGPLIGPLTLVGPGGVGKTFLLRKLREIAESQFEHGVLTLDGSALAGNDAFYQVLAGMLDISDSDARPAVLAYLASRQVLLLVDRVDDLTELRQEIDHLVSAAPAVRIATTSRAAMGVDGERIYEVRPLGLADRGGVHSDGVTLFAEIVQRVVRDFRLTASNLKLVRELCQIAMGVPLSISIIAGCATPNNLPDLVQNLKAPAEISIRSSVSHAFRLLSSEERTVLGRLTVFAGAFSFEDGRYVVDMPDAELSTMLAHLQQCGLVEAELTDAGYQYRLHDTVRDNVQEAPFERFSTQDRYAEVFSGKASYIGELMAEGRWSLGIKELLRNSADLRQAMRFSAEEGQEERVRKFADGLSRTYFEAGFLSDFALIAEAAYELNDDELTMRILGLEGALASINGDDTTCRMLWHRRLELARVTGDVAIAADALTDLAWQTFEQGELELAEEQLDESEALARSAGLIELVATAQIIRSRLRLEIGDSAGGLDWVERTLETLEDCTDKASLLFIYQGLARSYAALGMRQEEMGALRKLLDLATEGHRSIHVARSLMRLAPLYEEQGSIHAALNCYVAAAEVLNEYSAKDRKKAERELEVFLSRHLEIEKSVLEQARSTPWMKVVESL